MRVEELLSQLRECPIVASVQASEGSPLECPGVLAKLAQASVGQGVRVLRAQGVDNIRAIRHATGLATIGLIKRATPDSEVFITPSGEDVDALLSTDCEIVALDATPRPRPGGDPLPALVERIHAAGRLAMGDCDTLESVRFAVESGVDLVGTTLSGYTPDSPRSVAPDLELVVRAAQISSVPVLAEGRYSTPRQAHTALRCGAVGVVVGGALNDPVKQTRAFVAPLRLPLGPVAAFDLGGTWLRYGLFSDHWELQGSERVPMPQKRAERLDWMRQRARQDGAVRIGVGAGGTIDPVSAAVLESKPSIQDHVGTSFRELGLPVLALNDGLASAWGHACLPQYAGRRVATLALGTGVGCGLADSGRLVMGPLGQTLKLNDLRADGERTFEDLLAGRDIPLHPERGQIESVLDIAARAVETLQATCLPDAIVLCGGVGLAPWLDTALLREGSGAAARRGGASSISWTWPAVERSPFGENAGLFGAAALALFPPVDLAPLFDGAA